MSIEACKRLAGKREWERWAFGMVDGKLVVVTLKKNRFWFAFYKWGVLVLAYGETSGEYFGQRESAEEYFDELVQKYDLKEE